MKRNIKLKIAYEGRELLGWQKTQEGPSVEEHLQYCLEQILQEKIQLQAASRTDAGVHALGQVVNFFSQKNEMHCVRLKRSLNSLLPPSIVVLDAEIVDNDFHPTLHCVSKEYRYYICNGEVQLPQHRFFSWHFPYTLNFDDIDSAAAMLIGTRNFAAFCNYKKNERYDNHIRTVNTIAFSELQKQRIEFRIEGNHFLYKMVRNIIGTLLYVGCGKIPLKDLPKILENKNRTEAGVTAPAHGLFLYDIKYE